MELRGIVCETIDFVNISSSPQAPKKHRNLKLVHIATARTIEYFQVACSLQETALLRFSIAACLQKMDGKKELLEKPGKNLERGFDLKSGESFDFAFILNSRL